MQQGIEPSGWRTALGEMIAAAADALQRFPLTALFLVLAALDANLLVANLDPFPPEFLSRSRQEELVLALIAAALASYAATLFVEARRGAPWLRLALALGAGIAAFAIMWPSDGSHTIEWAFLAALAGLVPVAPFIGRGGSGSFWMFGARLVFAAALSVAALLLFGGGISAILASLTYLFGIPVPDDLYQHTWISIGLFVAPLFGLGQTPREFDTTPGDLEAGFMNRGMRALGDFAAAPLLLVYAIILHFYALKIVATQSVPQGQIGWLVLTYGSCIFGTLILCRPFLDRARAPTRLFMRLWPLLLPVPLALLFYALTLRVAAYGITPERFLLGLFAAVTAVLVLAQLFPRLRGDTRLIAGLPVAALLFASFGPQGAEQRAIVSQSQRFLALMKEQPVDEERKRQALDALRFLSGRQAFDRVRPDGIEPGGAKDTYHDIARAWGLDPDLTPVSADRIVLFNAQQPNAFAFSGFDLGIQGVQLYAAGRQPVMVALDDGRNLTLALGNDAFEIGIGDESAVTFPISEEMIRSYSVGNGGKGGVLRLEAEGRAVLVVPYYLYADMNQEPRLKTVSGALLLRRADW